MNKLVNVSNGPGLVWGLAHSSIVSANFLSFALLAATLSGNGSWRYMSPWLLMQFEKWALSICTDTYPTPRKWKWGKYGEIDIFSVYIWLFGWINLTMGILRDGNWSFYFLHSSGFGFGHRCFSTQLASQEVPTSFHGYSCGNICWIISWLYKILAKLTWLIALDSVKDNSSCLSLYYGSLFLESQFSINFFFKINLTVLSVSIYFVFISTYTRWR